MPREAVHKEDKKLCRFKSGIILRNKIVIAQGADDSHSTLLQELGIKDDYIGATKTFVRAELVPPDDEWWTDPETWEFVVDQDITPDWFDQTTYETDFRAQVHKWWQEHVHTTDVDVLSDGYHRIKDCYVSKLMSNVLVEMYGSSRVGEMYDSSRVGKMCGSSRVGKMYDNAIAIDCRQYPKIKVLVADDADCAVVRYSEATNE